MRKSHRTLTLLLVPLLLLVHAPFSLAQIEGETWTSPTYGFSVSWAGTNWQPDNNATLAAVGTEHLDRLHLIDGISSLYFEGAARYEGDPSPASSRGRAWESRATPFSCHPSQTGSRNWRGDRNLSTLPS